VNLRRKPGKRKLGECVDEEAIIDMIGKCKSRVFIGLAVINPYKNQPLFMPILKLKFKILFAQHKFHLKIEVFRHFPRTANPKKSRDQYFGVRFAV